MFDQTNIAAQDQVEYTFQVTATGASASERPTTINASRQNGRSRRRDERPAFDWRTDHENGLGEALLPCRQGGGPPQPSTIEILPERYA